MLRRPVPVHWAVAAIGCLLLFLLLLTCALVFIPPMLDHDWDSQSAAYGLIHALTPMAVTDHCILYQFGDPPLLSFCIGGVAWFRGSLDDLAYHYELAKGLEKKWGIFPPADALNEAVEESRRRFLADPHLLETRLPSILFATASLPLLFLILERMAGSSRLGGLGCLLYFTFPEVVVRSSHGGYTAVSIFFLLMIAYGILWENRRIQFIGGFLGALAKHPVGILPAAAALWTARFQPALMGFLLGFLCLVLYGLWVHPQAFWVDFIWSHLLDRIFHLNTGGSYPSVLQLWRQFNQVQGFLFLPLAAVGVGWMLIHSRRTKSAEGVIPLWAVIGAGAFSIVDWRQTKHLMYIVPALVAALIGFVGSQKGGLRWCLAGLIGVMILHNILRIVGSGGNLLGLHPSGDW